MKKPLFWFLLARFIFASLASLTVSSGCASLPDNSGRAYSSALHAHSASPLGATIEQFLADNIPDHSSELANFHKQDSGVYPIPSGMDAFVARVVLARKAQSSIDLQYYLFHNDTTGKLLLKALIEAADRGVRVRMLLDDMGLEKLDKSLLTLNEHEFIEVRVWNPFYRKKLRAFQYLTRFGTVTRRMHNKTFTIDGIVSIIGGRNLGDEYFSADPKVTFGDLDVAMVGAVVPQVSRSFDQYWNNQLSYPVSDLRDSGSSELEAAQLRKQLAEFEETQTGSAYYKALQSSSMAQNIRAHSIDFQRVNAEVLADNPDKTRSDRTQSQLRLATRLEPHVRKAQSQLSIVSPYFVPGKVGTGILVDLVRNGVKVRVLTNSLATTDVPAVHAGYIKYRKQLLRGGVELYELNQQGADFSERSTGNGNTQSTPSLHAKYLTIDRQKVFIGSMNLDPRSVVENTEIGVLIQDEAMGKKTTKDFDRLIKSLAFQVTLTEADKMVWTANTGKGPTSSTRVLRHDPDAPWWLRMIVNVMRWLPGESQL